MKAAEEASRQKAAAELKLQRNRDREAARIALEKVGPNIFLSHIFTLIIPECSDIHAFARI